MKKASIFWSRTWVLLLVLLTAGTFFTSTEAAEVRVQVDGLACPFCAYGMEKKLKKLEGLKELKILVDEGRAVLTFPPGQPVDFDAVQEAIRKGGFTPEKIDATLTGNLAKVEDRLLLRWNGVTEGILLSPGPMLDRLEASVREGEEVTVTGEVTAEHLAGHGEHPYAITVEHFETASGE